MERLARLSAGGGVRWRAVVTLLLLVCAGWGLTKLHALDDLRELQSIPQRLARETSVVNKLLGTPAASGFLLVRGANLEVALQHERALDATAYKFAPDAVLVGLSGFLPSTAQQRTSLAAWRKLLGDRGTRLKHALTVAGLPKVLVLPLVAAWRGARHGTVAPTELLDAAPELRHLVVHASDATGLIVQVYGDVNQRELAELARNTSAVEYVDPLARLNATFASIRWHAAAWVGVGYLAIFLLLFLRYGPLGGAVTMIPSLAAAVVTLGILGWAAQPLNIFVVVALMLVAGVGVDYAVFLREGARRPHSATALAVACAAVTTLASFGLLALSRIPSIHSFGLTVALGILVSWLAAPLALVGKRTGP